MSQENRKMNILLINNYFPPEIGAASHLYYYLAKELAARGHSVKVLTGIPRYNLGEDVYESYKRRLSGKNAYIDHMNGFEVIRVKLPLVDRKKLVRRAFEHFEIAYELYTRSKKLIGTPDVVLVYSPPLPLYWTGARISKKFNAPFILNVQDLFPQEIIDLGLLRNKILISFFRKIERKAYQSADLITVHSQKNKDFIVSCGVSEEKVLVFENWIDDREITPGSKNNPFAIKYRLQDKFVVSFAGTLGLLQDIEVIIKTANLLRTYSDIIFVIVGDGPRKQQAEKLTQEQDLQNVLFVPAVPLEEYGFVLNSSDVSLSTLVSELKTPVVPSKILSIMSAGIPVVASMNLDGDAPKLVEKAKCGFVVGAGDYENLAKCILEIYNNPALKEELGRNGRRYIEELLSAKKAAEKYENIFYKLIEKGR